MPLGHYLIVSGILFCTGFFGVLVRRNIIVIFMCLEMMLAAGLLAVAAFSRAHPVDGLPDYNLQTLVFFVIAVAAAEVAVGLAIIVALFRSRQSINLEHLDTLRG